MGITTTGKGNLAPSKEDHCQWYQEGVMHCLETFPSTCPSLLHYPACLFVLEGRREVSEDLIVRMFLPYCHAGSKG